MGGGGESRVVNPIKGPSREDVTTIYGPTGIFSDQNSSSPCDNPSVL